MANINEYLENKIIDLCDERDKFEAGSKERVQHDKNLVGMFDAYNESLKLEQSEESEKRTLEYEKEKYLAEIEQKDREAKKKNVVEWVKTVLYGFGLVGGGALALLARKDERDGFIVDDKISFFDKFKKDKI